MLRILLRTMTKRKTMPTSSALAPRPSFLHIIIFYRPSVVAVFFHALSEFVGIRNALHGLSQEVRKRYFKNERFMEAWIEGINYLIRQWDAIREKFMG